ncbi:MAG: hypothetical protein U9P14_05390 [Gemmatimonadota bacterium]|nr:hypothetical protein [Gemmatimonadota bacterium]
MRTCPVCFAEIKDNASKCRYCLSFIKPRTNEGQFWGTCLMVGGILIGTWSYIVYLIKTDDYYLVFLVAGVILAFLGFLVFGLGTFRSGFIRKQKAEEEEQDLDLESGMKKCPFCNEIIDVRAVKCRFCFSFLRQEKGKILATFITVSGILVITAAYIGLLARNMMQSDLYMQAGVVIIIAGVMMFFFSVMRNRYGAQKQKSDQQQI